MSSGPSVAALTKQFEKGGRPRVFGQIVIGAGSSALNFLDSALKGANASQFVFQSTLVIGEQDLWAQMQPDHAMGQPGKVLRNVDEWKQNGNSWEKQQFLSSEGYVKSLEHMKDSIKVKRENAGAGIEFLADRVQMVKLTNGGQYSVSTLKNGVFTADQVIVASGAGPGKRLDSKDPRNPKVTGGDLLAKSKRVFQELCDATDYLFSTPPEGLLTIIYGGSATASWAAAHALMHGADFVWMCAKGMEQIRTEGNPVTRNTTTIQICAQRNRILKGEIKAITVQDAGNAALAYKGGLPSPRILVQGRFTPDSDPEAPTTASADNEFRVHVHQVVHALGADPLGDCGPGAILDPAIRSELEVLWDTEGRVGARQTAIAFRHKRHQLGRQGLWVLGTPVFRGAGMDKDTSKKVGDSYQTTNETLPHCARPPEGIANLKLRIQALTGFTEQNARQFNWSIASEQQIVELLLSVYGPGFSEALRREFAKLVLKNRANVQFAVTHEHVKSWFQQFKQEKKFGFDVQKLLTGVASQDAKLKND